MRKQMKNRLISSVLSTVVVSSLLFPGAAGASSKGAASSVKQELQSSESIQNKISSSLKKSFKKEEKTTFLIKFKDQADTQKAAKSAVKKAKSKKLTAAKTEYQKRSAVVSSLKVTADEAQKDVLKYLNSQKNKGNADDIHSYYVVNGIAVHASKEVMEKVAQFPEVEKVLPNEKRQLFKSSASPFNMKKAQKAIKATDGVEWNVDQIDAPKAWELGYDGTGTVVASIDTGVEWEHPALKEKYRGFHPESPNEPDHDMNWFDAIANESSPYDDLDHGTHVTGTMVGSEPDGTNQIGVAPGAKWIAVKAFSEDGGTDADILEAGEWILAPKDAEGNPHPEMAPDVVNNSWGGGSGLDEWYRDMVNAWRAADIFPEFSAGNADLFNPGGPGSIANPANYPEAFATGATDINKKLGDFSLQGPSPYDETKPEISAPGVNIRSSVPGQTYEDGWDGTSMAGPHVSAVAALLKQADASLSVDEMEDILTSTAEPLTDSTFPDSPNNGYGHGLVNAFDAVSAVTDGLGKAEGQVSVDGEDDEQPGYQHEKVNEAYEGASLPLTLTAEDNVSVTSVKLSYKLDQGEWNEVKAKRISGDHLKGTYQAEIPSIKGTALSYKWIIQDFGGHVVESDIYDVSVKPSITVGYRQDFETEPGGWLTSGTNNNWEWGVPESGPNAAASGEKVYGTNLTGNYANGANMNLTMPPIDVPDSGSLFLQFKSWHNLENDFDYGYVFVLPEGETNWEQAGAYNGKTSNWTSEEINLSAYRGQNIRVMFNLQSDESIAKEGWYVDDVQLSDKSSGKTAKKNKLGVQKPAEKQKKKAVNPKKAKPSTNTAAKTKHRADMQPQALPLRAQVSVVETGKSTYSDQSTGQYKLTHKAGDYTLMAEAYGYQSKTQKVSLQADQTTQANFTLEEIKKGTLKGTVINKTTGEPVKGASVYVIEDAAVEPATTNDKGEYALEAYEGSYTIKVAAPGYYSDEFSVDLKGDITKETVLKPFVGYPSEIGYDDGTAENANSYFAAGNGWAVKMSLADGKEKGMLTGGLFRFWDTEFPDPGGTEFKVEVYDATGKDGAPGKKIAGPYNAEALRNGEWTKVDLSSKGIMVDKDFYLVYIQSKPDPYSPGLAMDETGQYSDRNWQYVNGAWQKGDKEDGNYMIRALVDYEAAVPDITSPEDKSYTNKENVTVKGKASPGTTVTLYNGDKEAGETKTAADGTFEAGVSLSKGENKLTAAASTDSGTTDASSPVTVTLDQEKPELTLDNPKNGEKINKETLTVKGTVSDDNLKEVKVNGKKATVTDGSYSARILLENGSNEVKVTATDLAGNKTTKKAVIDVNFDQPVITGLIPGEDKTLKAGESVKIAFSSAKGADATFVIRLPLTNARANVQNATELPLREISPGRYEGYWTATSSIKANGAKVEVIVRDDYGNETRKTANGKLYINTEK
ncbi:S8 family serine peptidase [Bacillus halotolerans]|uniref:S8 family serine peptidase n=1 Tax=Bacillus halotolerans TaxID=260554 RepID=UPI002DBC4772|nr:S8 family serine peptidase [Bacillus halotolerans]MEC0251521.1 S8 family serine peptidase [Bacillus halotolerans]MEC0358757.1 S8 family serine peptidase [Bacillus halotolerans]